MYGDSERLFVANTLMCLLRERSEFIGETRFRDKEWARLVFHFYMRVRSDDKPVAVAFMQSCNKRTDLSDRSLANLKRWDSWLAKLGGTASLSDPTEGSATEPSLKSTV